METIQAEVNARLLSKAQRLFTGTLDGRITEVLQNARRAGATTVHITNQDGRITVQDNGRGITDFSVLLDLGRSNWDGRMESAEDPAGVGIFCLSPREVCICSGHKEVVISENGWTGEPVPVHRADEFIPGTALVFQDDPWAFEVVERHAVFTGVKVIIDGRECACEPFVSEAAVPHPELGCRIEVREREALSSRHAACKQCYYSDNVLVNFHGQVVPFTYTPVGEHLQFLVDLTGEPTAVRLMLPARTRLVENEAFGVLKAALEIEAYRYIQRRGSHRLKYSEHCRAKELGIELPEAEPTFTVGLLTAEPVEPAAVVKPADLPLQECYRLGQACLEADEHNEANVHLLSALGKFACPFVVVNISSDCDGYSWARLPTVEQVQVTADKQLALQQLWSEVLVAVETLQITVRTSDGKVFTSAVPMAVRTPSQSEDRPRWADTEVLLTLAAREQLASTDIWYHLGGWSEDGDTYDTQLDDFEKDLELFWANLLGPGEYLRSSLLDFIAGFGLAWRSITVESSGKVWISYKDGTAQMLQPPELSGGS